MGKSLGKSGINTFHNIENNIDGCLRELLESLGRK